MAVVELVLVQLEIMLLVFTVTGIELFLMYQVLFEVLEHLNQLSPCSDPTTPYLQVSEVGVGKGGRGGRSHITMKLQRMRRSRSRKIAENIGLQ